MHRSSILSFSVFLLLFVLFVPGRAAETVHKGTGGPFEVSPNDGTPLVEVHFSDTTTGLFAIDTGAYDSVMTLACAKRLGFPGDKNAALAKWALFQANLAPEPPQLKVPHLEVDHLRVTDLIFQVAPTGSFGTNNGRPIDGLLGGTLLSHFALMLDYPRRTLTWISPGNLSDAVVTELGMDPKAAIGLHQELGPFMGRKVNHYSAPIKFGSAAAQAKEELFLDTGASLSSISASTARRLALIPAGVVPYRFVFQAPDLASRAVVPTLQIGPQVFSDVSVMYPSHRDSQMVSLLGANVFGGCRVLLDFGPHRCFLQPVLPGFAPGPPPPLNSNKIDWDRLRHAPDAPGFLELIQAVRTPQTLEGVGARVARLRAEPLTGSADAARDEQLGLLLRVSGDTVGAKTAWDAAVSRRRAEAETHPDEAAPAAALSNTLLLAGRSAATLDAARKNAVRWPDAPVVWRSLGGVAEAQAATLLLGSWNKTVTDREVLDPLPTVERLLDKPEAARVQQIAALRREARESWSKAAALAPQDADTYGERARFWVLDGWLSSLLQTLAVKDRFPSTQAALAGSLSDYQNEARLRPDDPETLRRVVLLDTALPLFHDGKWLRLHLHDLGVGLGIKNSDLITATAAEARLLALSTGPDPARAADALSALAEVQAAQDDPAAEATLRHVLARDPACPHSLAALALRLVTENRLADLRDLLVPAAKTESPAAMLLLAATQSALGDADAAEVQTRAALKALPDSPEASLMLASLLLARSGYDFGVLPEVDACLAKAEAGWGTHATDAQKASLRTLRAVWLAQSSDPVGARRQLLSLLHDYPTCTQAREALSAMTIPPDAP